jgi:diacylglycerol kinase (ATP)
LLTRATLIYNPIAGGYPARRQEQVRKAAEALRRSGFVLAIQPTPGPGSAGSLAQAAARSGADLVIVCGGDGTINEAINGLATGETPLAILAGGTANIAAKELGLPHDPVAAARELSRWQPRRVALGRVTWGPTLAGPAGTDGAVRSSAPASPTPAARYFLSVAGVGYDAYVVHSLSQHFKDSFGVVAYGWEAVRQLRRYTFPVVVCRSGDREWRGTLALFQRGERYAGWLHLVPGARLFEDRLRLCLFESARPSRYFLYAAAVLLRRHFALKDVQWVDCNSVACSAADPQARVYVELDGELAGELPARFEIVSDALTLLTRPV